LAFAAVGATGLALLSRNRVTKIAPYVLIGLFMWVCVLKSGVHATLAGVLTALFIPLHGKTKEEESPLMKAEHSLHPWVAFMILPIFAFANAGISFSGLSLSDLLSPVPLGIAAGLFLGKPIGVLFCAFIATQTKIARLPQGVNWVQMAGVACLTGVGFTMSLFIGGLAFNEAAQMNEVRIGVLMGSILSGVVGYTLLRVAAKPAPLGVQEKAEARPEPADTSAPTAGSREAAPAT
ncbi:MAG: Na+/H+ antiporter NhaA, partial [Pseudomonadota bacterium]